jgi:hypothetical protein
MTIRPEEAEFIKLATPAITLVAGLLGGFWVVWVFWRSKRREAAQWMHALFEKFQLGAEFDKVKIMFDFGYREEIEPLHAALVAGGNDALVVTERPNAHLVDRLLNYLEHILYLTENGHARWNDSKAYFQYWFGLLKAPERGAMRRYLAHFGYEHLARFAGCSSKRGDFILLYGSLMIQLPRYTGQVMNWLVRRTPLGRLRSPGIDAWVYVYNRPVGRWTRITAASWPEHLDSRAATCKPQRP